MTTINLFQHSDDTVSYAAGQHIFKAGDEGDFVYVVISGEVDLILGDKVVETVGPGGILGEMALIEHKPRIASAIANTDCRLIRIGEKQFMFLIQVTSYFALQLMRVMAERLRRVDEYLLQKP
jgi:CRP/FNR family transcriptional regulator, cyclic AMP receptor protein